MKYGEGCERMEQENGRKEKLKTTVITLRMVIRHDDRHVGSDDYDDDDSNNSNTYKSKACCSEVMYIIGYLFIGAGCGNIRGLEL